MIEKGHEHIKIATIDTMLSFYLAFLYADRPYYDPDRIICMSKFLFDVQDKNRLEQKGLLKRFSITCYGHQQSIEEMRAEKSEKFKELVGKKGTKEYNEWFLSYKPGEKMEKNLTIVNKIVKPFTKKIKKYKKRAKTMKKYVLF